MNLTAKPPRSPRSPRCRAGALLPASPAALPEPSSSLAIPGRALSRQSRREMLWHHRGREMVMWLPPPRRHEGGASTAPKPSSKEHFHSRSRLPPDAGQPNSRRQTARSKRDAAAAVGSRHPHEMRRRTSGASADATERDCVLPTLDHGTERSRCDTSRSAVKRLRKALRRVRFKQLWRPWLM